MTFLIFLLYMLPVVVPAIIAFGPDVVATIKHNRRNGYRW
jgi:hypothetical protein